MAHKTRINGTAYGITGGKTLVNGTSYSVKNGKALIGGTAYDISFKKQYPPNVQDFWTQTSSADVVGPAPITGIVYANGYWVVCGYTKQGEGSYDYYAYIAYAKSLDGPWTTKELWYANGTYYDMAVINCITFENGYFVVGGRRGGGTNACARIAYATSPDGTWTIKDIWTNFHSEINSLTYANGYWVAGGRAGTNSNGIFARIAYSTSLDGTWTTKNLFSTGSNGDAYVKKLLYGNGYFTAACCYRNSDTSTEYPRIAYATTPSGTWTTKDLWSTSVTYSYINDLIYSNGYWVAVGRYYSSSTYYAKLAYATSPAGTWTTKNLWSGASGNKCDLYDIIHDDNGFVVRGYDAGVRWCTAISPDGTWTDVTVPASSISSIYFIDYIDGNYLEGGYVTGSTNTARLINAPTLEELGTTQ